MGCWPPPQRAALDFLGLLASCRPQEIDLFAVKRGLEQSDPGTKSAPSLAYRMLICLDAHSLSHAVERVTGPDSSDGCTTQRRSQR
eukprot:1396971-Amphidinium_carterae.1